VLSNVAPPCLRRKAATDNMLYISSKIIQTGLCTLMSLSIHPTACISTSNMVRHDICRQNHAVERGLVVGFCRQPHYCNRPYYPTVRFRSPSSYMVSVEPFPDGSRSMSCKFAQMRPHPITFLRLWPATDHEPHCRHVPTDKIWRRTESTALAKWNELNWQLN